MVEAATNLVKDEIFKLLLKFPDLRIEPPSMGIDNVLGIVELGQVAVAEVLAARVTAEPGVFLAELDRFDRGRATGYRIVRLASLSTFMLPSIDLLDYARIMDKAARILIQGRPRAGPCLASLHSKFIDWIRGHSDEQVRHLLQDCQDQEDDLLVVTGWLEAFIWDDCPETSDVSTFFVAAVAEKDLGRAIAVLKQGNLSDDLVMVEQGDIKFCHAVIDKLFEIYDGVKESDVIGKISLSKSIMNLLKIPSIKASYSNIDSISYAIINGNEQLVKYLASECPSMVFDHSTMGPLYLAIVHSQPWAIDLMAGKFSLDLNHFKWIIQQWSISAKPATILTLICHAKELFKGYSHQQHLILLDYVLYLINIHLKAFFILQNSANPAMFPDLDPIVWNHHVKQLAAMASVEARLQCLQSTSQKFSRMLQVVQVHIKGRYLSEWETQLAEDLAFANQSGYSSLASYLNFVLYFPR